MKYWEIIKFLDTIINDPDCSTENKKEFISLLIFNYKYENIDINFTYDYDKCNFIINHNVIINIIGGDFNIRLTKNFTLFNILKLKLTNKLMFRLIEPEIKTFNNKIYNKDRWLSKLYILNNNLLNNKLNDYKFDIDFKKSIDII